jgi:hypothetical protein
MSLIDRLVTILDFPEVFGLRFEDYLGYDQDLEPLPATAQDAVLDTAIRIEYLDAPANIAHLQVAREILNPAPPLA